MVGRYNDIYRVQMPNITFHVCRHTYCSNMAKSGMNPKTLQYLMGHSDYTGAFFIWKNAKGDDIIIILNLKRGSGFNETRIYR